MESQPFTLLLNIIFIPKTHKASNNELKLQEVQRQKNLGALLVVKYQRPAMVCLTKYKPPYPVVTSIDGRTL